MASKLNCSCSRYCRVHGTRTNITEICYTKVGIDKGKTLTLGNKNSDNTAKELLCKIIHDKAINKLCKKYGLMVTTISEHMYIGSDNCIGLNINCSDISITLRYDNNTFLDYFEIIAIIIHELVHHSNQFHNENFKKLENEYRATYISYARTTGQVPSWTPIEFPKSSGSGLAIGKTVSYFTKIKHFVQLLQNKIKSLVYYFFL
jgi:hypothetical protein